MAGRVTTHQVVLQAGQSPFQASPFPSHTGAREVPWRFAENSSTLHIFPQSSSLTQESDALFLISSSPALVAFCILLCRAIQHVPYRPRWIRRFVNEHIEDPKSFNSDESVGKRPHLPKGLLALTAFGLITQITLTFLPVQDLTPIPRVLAWVRDAL